MTHTRPDREKRKPKRFRDSDDQDSELKESREKKLKTDPILPTQQQQAAPPQAVAPQPKPVTKDAGTFTEELGFSSETEIKALRDSLKAMTEERDRLFDENKRIVPERDKALTEKKRAEQDAALAVSDRFAAVTRAEELERVNAELRKDKKRLEGELARRQVLDKVLKFDFADEVPSYGFGSPRFHTQPSLRATGGADALPDPLASPSLTRGSD